MIQQRIAESIEAIVHYNGEKIIPLKFRWRNRVYRIKQIAGSWINKEGSFRHYHYVTDCHGEEIYEISFSTKSMQWQLIAISSQTRPYLD